MNQTSNPTLDDFGTAAERVRRAIEAIRAGNGILAVDDEDRENEGDLIFAAETITSKQMALMIRHCSGIVCLPMEQDLADQLDLPPMVEANTSSMGTNFTVSIEAKAGVTTGVSAQDRVTTIQAAIRDGAKPDDLARPGHIFPLGAHPGGVLARAGHTETAVELARLAGLKPAAVLCELTNDDGTMARLPQVLAFAAAHNMPVVTVEDLRCWLMEKAQAA